jgi:hypothetical protein
VLSSSSNLERPIGELVPEGSEEEEPDSLFMQLTSQLSMTELLALMQGNFGAIQGMNKRLKKVLLKKMGGKDTP